MHSPYQFSSGPESLPNGVLLIDNNDSFTYNIANGLAQLGADVRVVRNYAVTPDDLKRIDPAALIVGPGPGRPEDPEDVGITYEAMQFATERQRALLGVCLGHQALGHFCNGRIVSAQEIRHGKTSMIERTAKGGTMDLFQGVKFPAEVMRYHSLAMDPSFVPEELEVTAVTMDQYREIMAVRHRVHRLFGVQFHPESFATPSGLRILQNFLRLADIRTGKTRVPVPSLPAAKEALPGLPEGIPVPVMQRFHFHELPVEVTGEQLAMRLHAASEQSFCLESLDSGGAEGSHHLSYYGMRPEFVLHARNDRLLVDGREIPLPEGKTPFDIIEDFAAHMKDSATGTVMGGQHFSGGLVGFMGFEAYQYLEQQAVPEEARTPEGRETMAFGYFPDGIVYDREMQKAYYFTRGANRMQEFMDALSAETDVADPVIVLEEDEVSRETFERNVQTVRDAYIRTGESFQTVISRSMRHRIDGSMAPLYRRLREICPSGDMHAIRLRDHESIGSFPELALSVIDGQATTYQIAGTRRRTMDDLQDAAVFDGLIADEKEAAEHRMLVDLARNDLARASIPGTVEVTELMERLDAGPVMHIASEIQSRLNGMPSLRALLAALPIGTVSGAPKIRSTQILYKIEGNTPRGLYAGSFGCVDARGNIETVVGLRSLMRTGNELRIQAGAGIVFDSDPSAEYEETEAKMGVARKVIEPFLAQGPQVA